MDDTHDGMGSVGALSQAATSSPAATTKPLLRVAPGAGPGVLAPGGQDAVPSGGLPLVTPKRDDWRLAAHLAIIWPECGSRSFSRRKPSTTSGR